MGTGICCSLQGRCFQLGQLNRANRFCRSRSSTERPTCRTRTWGSRPFCEGSKAGMCPDNSLPKQAPRQENCPLPDRRAGACRDRPNREFWSIASRTNSRTNGGPDRMLCILWSTESAWTTRKLSSLRNYRDRLLDRRILCIHHQPHFGDERFGQSRSARHLTHPGVPPRRSTPYRQFSLHR